MRNTRRCASANILIFSVVLTLTLLALWSPTPSLAQSGGPYSLIGSAANAGQTSASADGRFELSDVMGQPDSTVLSGGRFELTGGIEQPAACPAGMPEAVRVTVGRSGNAIVLHWVDQPADSAYSIYRMTSPYLAPGPGDLLEIAWPGMQGFTDPDGAGDPSRNHTYVVRARCGALWSDANRVGGFSFPLASGD